MKIGIVKEPTVWLYEEDHKKISDQLFMGWAVGIFKEKDGWLEVVTHYGYVGCLRKEGICFSTPERLQRRDESGQTIFLNRAFTDVMEEPTVHSRILFTLSRGSFVTALSEAKKGYRRIRLTDGREGYVPCISYECRKDSDGYLYDAVPSTWFLRQKRNFCMENVFRRRLVEYSGSYLGTQYRWAGKSSAGLDCSGLTFMCYLMNGILIYRDAKIKEPYPIHQIPVDEVCPGDLLYFPGHVAMYIGNHRFIHATGNEKSFGCVIGSFCRYDKDYRKDLAEKLLMAGSIF